MRSSISAFVFVLLTISINAMGTNSPDLKRVLDSAMARSGLGNHDFWLEDEYAENVSHRLKIVDSCFQSPLYSFQIVDNFDDLLQEFNSSNTRNFCNTVFKSLEFDSYSSTILNTPVPGSVVRDYFGVDIDSVANFATAMVARQYLGAVYNTMEIMERNPAIKDFNKYSYISQNFDSVLMYVSDNSTNDLFESARKETDFRLKTQQFFEYSKSLSRSNTYSLAFSLMESLVELNTKYKDMPQLLMDSLRTVIIDTPKGKIAIGGKGNDVYAGDFILIVDFGGNDTYIFSDRTKYQAMQRPVCVLLDFGGDDNYISGNYNLGGTAFGISLLLDYSGNDNYIAKDVSLGSAFFGVGILYDFEGNDSYKGESYTQGSASFGIGLLIDNEGFDIYNSHSHSQGFASTRGFGALLDKSGDDSYISQSTDLDILRHEDRYVSFSQGASLGNRPYAGSGLAFLIDNSGNDVYKCDIFGQGVSYWFGLGGLIDKTGDDKYLSHQYSQGSGVHFAFGLLIEHDGNDIYQTYSVSQGCGHDVGFGSLIDFSGNDRYTADNLSLGGGNANAISLFVDMKGNDAYFASDVSNSFGYSDFRRNFGTPSLFIDADGLDSYQDVLPNNTFSSKSTFGFFYDADLFPADAPRKSSADKKVITPRSKRIEDLFIEATATALNDQQYVEPAIIMIAKKKQEALKFIEPKIGSKFPRERKAIEDILVEMNSVEPDILQKFLEDCLKSDNDEKIKLAVQITSRCRIGKLLPWVVLSSIHSKWQVREKVAQTLGDLYSKGNDNALLTLIEDSHPIVRAKAAYSLAKNLQPEYLPKLDPIMNDKFYAVRYNAQAGLKLSEQMSSETLLNALKLDLDSASLAPIINMLDKCEFDKSDLKKLKASIIKLSKENRLLIYQKLITIDKEKTSKIIKELVKAEKDKKLKALLKSSL